MRTKKDTKNGHRGQDNAAAHYEEIDDKPKDRSTAQRVTNIYETINDPGYLVPVSHVQPGNTSNANHKRNAIYENHPRNAIYKNLPGRVKKNQRQVQFKANPAAHNKEMDYRAITLKQGAAVFTVNRN